MWGRKEGKIEIRRTCQLWYTVIILDICWWQKNTSRIRGHVQKLAGLKICRGPIQPVTKDRWISQYCNIEISSFAAGSWIRWKIYDPWTNVSYEKANKKVFSLFCGICSSSCINATTIPSFLIPTRTRIHQEKKSQKHQNFLCPVEISNTKYEIPNIKTKYQIPKLLGLFVVY